VPVPFAEPATETYLRIYSDLNGDQDVDDTGEDITYEWIDSDNDGVKDAIQRTALGESSLMITNVSAFSLQYWTAGGVITTTPTPTSIVRQVQVNMTATSDRLDPATGNAISRDFEMTNYLWNFN
jgi:hypothetical protein